MIIETSIWILLFIAAYFFPQWKYKDVPTEEGMALAKYAAIKSARVFFTTILVVALIIRVVFF